MILCRVLGNVVSTIKHPHLNTLAIFSVQPLEADGSDSGESFLAVDHAQSGPGDVVLVLREGNGIRQILADPKSPVRCLIVGVVDQVSVAPNA
ncbi:MAG: EutN/CcmL family microcompartment protein [Myxococcota bacterium]|jgi:ethanolamine utilization protein EutN